MHDHLTPHAVHSVAKVGRRFFWVVWPSFFDYSQLKDPTHGYAATKDEAWRAADACAVELGSEPLPGYPPKVAATFHRVLATRKRVERGTDETASQAPEYVYHFQRRVVDFVLGQWPVKFAWKTCAHRVVKKTAKRIFVVRACDGNPASYHGVTVSETYALDREELEAGRRLDRGRIRSEQDFTLSPNPPDGVTDVPSCIAALGLPWPCSPDELKRAYRRLALEHHPDRGGDAAVFVEVQRAYEQALQLCGGAA